jgi:pSer/pThr/pTyr-binding forkhead associated (FHA) protein
MAKPVKCERCGRENDPSFAFCLDCGRAMPPAPPAPAPASACVSCGAALSPGFRFCGQCGASAGATPVPPRSPSPPPTALLTARGKGMRLASVRTDGAPGPVYPVDAPEVLCGRVEGDIRIADDGTVSPRHARFTLEGDRLTVEDLGTVNGTFIRIRAPHRLAVGEEIRLGRQLLRVEPRPRPPDTTGGTRAWGAPDPGFRLRLTQLLDGGGLGEIHPLREGENVVGREAGEVVFPGDRYVSARHAQIEVAGEILTLSDLGSSNGTFRRIAGPTVITPGDQLLVGAQLLKVEA